MTVPRTEPAPTNIIEVRARFKAFEDARYPNEAAEAAVVAARDIPAILAWVEEARLELTRLRVKVKFLRERTGYMREDVEERWGQLIEERDAALRELERWRHGVTIEGDFVCPHEVEREAAERAAFVRGAEAMRRAAVRNVARVSPTLAENVLDLTVPEFER